MPAFLQDARYGLRLLWRSPGFALVAILTIAVGVGANVAIYSVVDAVLIDPLPYEEPDRLVFLWGVEGGLKTGSNWNSYPDVVDFEERNEVFEEVGSLSSRQVTLTGDDREPMRVSAGYVSHDLLGVLGVHPIEGRGIRPEEDAIGGDPVVLLGSGLRHELFGEGEALGKTLTIDGTEHTIVGIMPSWFTLPGDARVWLPLDPAHAGDDRGQHRLLSIGRLLPGISLDLANTNIGLISAALESEYPESNHDRGARVEPMYEAFFGDVRPPLYMLMGAVGLILLITCANVANLLLARSALRRRELAVRLALGARPFRLVRQMLTESLLLSALGGLAGLAVAIWSLDLLLSLAPSTIPRIEEVGLNLRVLVFSIAITMLTGLLFGLFPAVQARRHDIQHALKQGGRGPLGGTSRNRARQVLVVAEIALAFVVVVGAGLLTNSFLRLQRVDPGFRGDDVLAARISLPQGTYPEWKEATRFFDELIDHLERIPGVESAAAGYEHPLSGGWETSFILPGVFEAPEGQRPEARILPITPHYFETVGVRLLTGRAFDEHDDETAPGVVIINESFSRQFFPEGDAVGHTLARSRWWPELPGDYEIIGVVADVKMDGLASGTPWAMYYPQKQVPFQEMYVFLRGSIDPMSLANPLRSVVGEMDRTLPIEGITTLGQIRHGALGQERFQVTLLNLFAVIALTLSLIGIYGVLAAGVVQRRGEIGIRMALGANRRDVLRSFVGQGARLTLVGLALGLAAALLATRLMSGLLFEISPTDPPTLGTVTLLFAAVALLACLIPAARATRVDPLVVLRSD